MGLTVGRVALSNVDAQTPSAFMADQVFVCHVDTGRCKVPDQDGAGRLRECPPARTFRASSALISRRRPAPSCSCPVDAMLAQHRSSTHAASSRQAVPGGGDFKDGWKNRLGAGARSAFVSFSPCLVE